MLLGFLYASAQTAVGNVGLKYGSRDGYLGNIFIEKLKQCEQTRLF